MTTKSEAYEKAHERAIQCNQSDGSDYVVMFDAGHDFGCAVGYNQRDLELAGDVAIEWKEEVGGHFWNGYVSGAKLVGITIAVSTDYNPYWVWMFETENPARFPSLAEAQAEAAKQITALRNILLGVTP